MPQKVVVLDKNDINIPFEKPGLVLKARSDLNSYYSTGILERALDAGHTVYVVSRRSSVAPYDQWWVDLVGKNNVFIAEPCPEGADNVEVDRRLNAGYRMVFDLLEITWPFPNQTRISQRLLFQELRKNGVLDAQDLR